MSPSFDSISAQLQWFSRYDDHPEELLKRPLASQFSELCWGIALIKTATSPPRVKEAKAVISTFGTSFHRSLLSRQTIEGAFRDWNDLLFFADNQRKWQRRIFNTSRRLRSAGRFANGTDDLAVEIAQGLETDVTGVRWTGPLYTVPTGYVGRRPSIEASISYGLVRPGYVAIDGKYPVTSKEVLKAAADCRSAQLVYRQARWIQPVLVLPCSCDVRSESVLEIATKYRVIIATTALPTMPRRKAC